MPKVKVWNDNHLSHREEFNGEWLEIPAGGSIDMEWEEAVAFKGQYFPIKIKGDGTHCPSGFKKIRVEPLKEPLFKDAPLVNHANGAVAATAEQLATMLAEFAHLRVVDKDAEAATPSQRSELDELKKQVAELSAMLGSTKAAEKKKPGPKPKAANG
jgi:hypothetical protein